MTASRLRNIILRLTGIFMVLFVVSCSTTSRIPDDEMLYTGIKKINYTIPENEQFPKEIKSQIRQSVNVKPNNTVMGVRLPFPIGLYIYNHWYSPSGFKHWIYDNFATEPVLISNVRPEVRVHMIDEILSNNGYFQGTASYSLYQRRNKKKAGIIYEINTGSPYPVDSVVFLPDTCHLFHVIDSIAHSGDLFHAGMRYCTDSLNELRVNITNYVRNRGYYFFRPEYIDYLADSTINPGKIALKMNIARNTPQYALWRYRTGEITTRIFRNEGGGQPDTFQTKRGTVIQMLPSRLRRNLIPECVTFRPGKIFSVRDMNNTQSYLARLGVFNGISINAVPDTLAISRGEHLLNVDIDCTFDKPMEVSLECNVSSKSNSYLGPGLTVGVNNRNIFGGGELLTIGLTGAYEWQTGHGNSTVFNSYEASLNASLSFPRLLAPGFRHSRRSLNWTRISLNADLLNRPHYFKMAQFNASFGYDWRVTRHVNMNWTVFKLTYNKLLNTTHEFDSIMNANRAIALSFRDQFVPQMSYTYLYDRTFDSRNTLNFQFNGIEAGNIFWAIYEACGKHGEKELFGTPFSQFIKATAQAVYGRRIHGRQWIVSRLGIGAAHAYGNASQVPYSEQFYVGGANSVRAFTVRSLGPGSYQAPAKMQNGYFDQTGTFKVEANVEYRFPIIGPLNGAAFLDAGNVWLLKSDPARPGGLLKGSDFLKELALGTGVGLRFDISMMVVRLDVGMPLHAPYRTAANGYFNLSPVKWKNWCLHFAIGYPF